MNSFDWEFYINYYDDLKKAGINTKDTAFRHWKRYGIKEGRVPFFDWKFYINYYDDLKNAGINTKELALNHWEKYGKNENRIPFSFDWEFYVNYYNLKNINNKVHAMEHYLLYGNKDDKLGSINHKYINYKFIDTYDNFNCNFTILEDIPLYINKNNLNFNNLNLNIEEFIDINLIKKPGIIINNSNISFEFLHYSKYKIKDIVKDSIFDIIYLSYDNIFFEWIKQDINIFPYNNYNNNCFYLTQSGIDKLNINPNAELNVGYYSRPLFNYKENSFIKNLWDSYYRVTSYFDKIYCINLEIEKNKRNDMKLYCNLLNCKEDEFFYNGILGLSLPNINELVELNYYNKAALNKNIKKGTIGLNITQLNIFKEAIEKNYNNILLLEDDIYFDTDYFLILDKIFNIHKNIDILYLGCSNYDNINNVFDKIDQIENYNLYKPKKILKKVCIGGLFAVYLSKKAINTFYERFKVINNISDILLCDIAFDIMNDFDSKEMTKTNYNLNTIFIVNNLFNVNINKPSLTEENNFKMFDISNNKIQYLIKINKINFLLKSNYTNIKIKFSKNMKQWYSKLIKLFLSLFNNYIEVEEDPHINFYTYHCKAYNKDALNIMINGEKADDNMTDIAILTTKKQTFGYNIYFPQIFSSLWERSRLNSTNLWLKGCNNTKEHFCAYMYSYNLEYRVKLFNEISKYKKVDALGKSCNDANFKDSRFVYNENQTYNDIAVEIYSKYKFVLALENGIEDGYITEKILNPLLANSIPIYAGPSDVFNIINKKRIIYVYDFKNTNELIDYIKLVDNNDDIYNSIINNEIWIGDLNLDTYENYILNEFKKALNINDV